MTTGNYLTSGFLLYSVEELIPDPLVGREYREKTDGHGEEKLKGWDKIDLRSGTEARLDCKLKF